MYLLLYKNFRKKENSTKIPTGTGTGVNVVMKRETSMTSPVFLLSREHDIDLDVNYAHLYNGRYYFVDDIVVGNNDMFEIHCHVDVLASYRNDVFNANVYVERSASNYNPMFIDPYVSVQSNVVSRDYAFNETGFSNSGGCYIVRIAGGDSDGVSTFAVAGLSELAPIFDKSNYVSSTDDAFTKIIGNYIFDPFDYVIGLYWCPIPLQDLKNLSPAVGTDDDIYVKWFDTGIDAFRLFNDKKIYKTCGCVNLPTNIYTDFRKYDNRFSNYNVYIPAVGNVPIDANNANNLIVEYYISLDTGATRIMLINSNGNTFISSYNTNIYKSIQYGETTTDPSSVLGGVFNTIGGIASGNVPLAVAGGLSVAQNIIVPTPSIAGSNSGLGVQGANKVIISLDNYGSGSLDIANFGRPSHQKLSLATLTGFTKCSGASIEIAGFESEKTALNAYVNGGFYIE